MPKRPDIASLVLFPDPTSATATAVERSASEDDRARTSAPHRYGDYFYATAVAGKSGGPSGYAIVYGRRYPPDDSTSTRAELALHACHLSPDACVEEVKKLLEIVCWQTQEMMEGRLYAVERLEYSRMDPAWDRARELAERAAEFTDYDMRAVVRRLIVEGQRRGV